MRARRFTKGPQFESLGRAVEVIASGQYVMLHDRPCHPGFMVGMPLRALMMLFRAGRLSVAIDEQWNVNGGPHA